MFNYFFSGSIVTLVVDLDPRAILGSFYREPKTNLLDKCSLILRSSREQTAREMIKDTNERG